MELKKKDMVWLIWKDLNSRSRFKIGEVVKKDNKFSFTYDIEEVNKALELNFKPLLFFPYIHKKYICDSLFPAFLSRLPDKRRPDIKQILFKYELEEYDAYLLLKKSGAKLPTDSFEFIEPILLNNGDAYIERKFFIAGVRHYDVCHAEDCYTNFNLEVGQRLKLVREFENKFDKYAVLIFTLDDKKIGYMPKFYSRATSEAMEKDFNINCQVVNFYHAQNCEECLQALLNICITK